MITLSISGCSPSVTKACSAWLSIGSRSPAIAATREELPAQARPIFAGADKAARGLDADSPAILLADAGHLAILDDIDAQPVGRARIAPGHRIMPHRAAALLQQAALDREPRIFVIQIRHHFAFTAAQVQQFGIDAVQPHGIAAPRIGIALRIGMDKQFNTPRWLTIAL